MRSETINHALPAANTRPLATYFAVLEAGIPDLVADRYLQDRTPLVIRDDVMYGLIKVLEAAVLGSGIREPWADVSMINDPCAWGYALLRARVPFVTQDVLRERRHLAESSVEELEQVLVAPQSDPSVEMNPLTLLAEIPVDEHLHYATGLRRLHLQAAHLREFLQVPEITAPFTRSQRDQLLALIVASPHVAVDSLDRICGGSDGAGHPLDALWDAYSPTDACRLLHADHRTIQLLVTSALSPRSRPGRAVLQQHRKLIKNLSRARGWPSSASALQRAWLAEYYSHTSDKGIRRSPDDTPPEWKSACLAVASHPNSPLGCSADAIDQAMLQLLSQAEQLCISSSQAS